MSVASRPAWLHLSRPRNMMCHNMCSVLTPPPRFSSLLGLGLNFCLQPVTTSTKRTLELSNDRFRRDIFTKMCFAHTDNIFSGDQLFIRSEWQPPSNTVSADFRGRVNQFLNVLKSKFKYKRYHNIISCHTNDFSTTLGLHCLPYCQKPRPRYH
jgi:hypothetical protein